MPLTEADVRHVARLARLALTDEEVSTFREQLSKVLEYVDKLSELDLSEVEAEPYPAELTLPTRPDEPTVTLANDEALRNAAETEEGSFLVPRIIG